MAKLSNDDVLNLARLSRLKLTDDEVNTFANEISAILGYVEQLQLVDLKGYDATLQVTGLTNVMRADEVTDYGPTTADLIKNAPDTEDGHFKVKRMIA